MKRSNASKNEQEIGKMKANIKDGKNTEIIPPNQNRKAEERSTESKMINKDNLLNDSSSSYKKDSPDTSIQKSNENDKVPNISPSKINFQNENRKIPPRGEIKKDSMAKKQNKNEDPNKKISNSNQSPEKIGQADFKASLTVSTNTTNDISVQKQKEAKSLSPDAQKVRPPTNFQSQGLNIEDNNKRYSPSKIVTDNSTLKKEIQDNAIRKQIETQTDKKESLYQSNTDKLKNIKIKKEIIDPMKSETHLNTIHPQAQNGKEVDLKLHEEKNQIVGLQKRENVQTIQDSKDDYLKSSEYGIGKNKIEISNVPAKQNRKESKLQIINLEMIHILKAIETEKLTSLKLQERTTNIFETDIVNIQLNQKIHKNISLRTSQKSDLSDLNFNFTKSNSKEENQQCDIEINSDNFIKEDIQQQFSEINGNLKNVSEYGKSKIQKEKKENEEKNTVPLIDTVREKAQNTVQTFDLCALNFMKKMINCDCSTEDLNFKKVSDESTNTEINQSSGNQEKIKIQLKKVDCFLNYSINPKEKTEKSINTNPLSFIANIDTSKEIGDLNFLKEKRNISQCSISIDTQGLITNFCEEKAIQNVQTTSEFNLQVHTDIEFNPFSLTDDSKIESFKDSLEISPLKLFESSIKF